MENKATEPTLITPKKKKRLLVGLILTAVAVLIAGLAYVYWYQNPSRVVGDALLHAANAHSAIYKGTVTRSGATKMVATLNGGISKIGATANAEFIFDTAGKKYTLEGNSVVDNSGDAYIKVRNIDGLVNNYRRAIPENSQKLFDQVIAKIDDKWIKVSATDIQSYSADAAKLQKCVVQAAKKIQSDQTQKTQLMNIYEKHPFVAIDKNLGAKDGSLGYVVSIDKSAYRSFNSEAKNTGAYKSLSGCDTSFEMNDGNTSVANKPQLELWISRWTHRITKIASSDEAGGQTLNIAVEPTFDRPVAVVVPKNSTTLEQLQKDVQSLLSSSQPGASTPTP
jgi:hypothetical protein